VTANSWRGCPRCFDRAHAEWAEKRDAVLASYGHVTVEEFDAARATIPPEPVVDEFPTFREDYEFSGASHGVLDASYGGVCTECGLSVEFETKRDFYRPENPTLRAVHDAAAS
jgi:hypothetical protein